MSKPWHKIVLVSMGLTWMIAACDPRSGSGQKVEIFSWPTMSGGWIMRAHLARLLVRHPTSRPGQPWRGCHGLANPVGTVFILMPSK